MHVSYQTDIKNNASYMNISVLLKNQQLNSCFDFINRISNYQYKYIVYLKEINNDTDVLTDMRDTLNNVRKEVFYINSVCNLK